MDNKDKAKLRRWIDKYVELRKKRNKLEERMHDIRHKTAGVLGVSFGEFFDEKFSPTIFEHKGRKVRSYLNRHIRADWDFLMRKLSADDYERARYEYTSICIRFVD